MEDYYIIFQERKEFYFDNVKANYLGNIYDAPVKIKAHNVFRNETEKRVKEIQSKIGNLQYFICRIEDSCDLQSRKKFPELFNERYKELEPETKIMFWELLPEFDALLSFFDFHSKQESRLNEINSNHNEIKPRKKWKSKKLLKIVKEIIEYGFKYGFEYGMKHLTRL